jgi:hypothetical protein
LRVTLEPIRSFLNATKNRNSGISIAILAALLVVACSSGPRGNKTMPPGIHVELDPDKPLTLKVAVRSGSLLPATFDKNRLPWATSYSMILVAARQPDGRVLARQLPIEDTIYRPIHLLPAETLVGQIDLRKCFRDDIETVLKTTDIQLFWAYEAPPELHIPRSSGGWILLPQQK